MRCDERSEQTKATRAFRQRGREDNLGMFFFLTGARANKNSPQKHLGTHLFLYVGSCERCMKKQLERLRACKTLRALSLLNIATVQGQ